MKRKTIASICGVILALSSVVYICNKIHERQMLDSLMPQLGKLKEEYEQRALNLEQRNAEIYGQFTTQDTVHFILPEEFYHPTPIYHLDSVKASKYIEEFPDSINDIKLNNRKSIKIKRCQVVSFSGFYHGSVGYTYRPKYSKDAFSFLGILNMPHHVKYGTGDDRGTIILRFKADKPGKHFISIYKIFRQDTLNITTYRIEVLE